MCKWLYVSRFFWLNFFWYLNQWRAKPICHLESNLSWVTSSVTAPILATCACVAHALIALIAFSKNQINNPRELIWISAFWQLSLKRKQSFIFFPGICHIYTYLHLVNNRTAIIFILSAHQCTINICEWRSNNVLLKMLMCAHSHLHENPNAYIRRHWDTNYSHWWRVLSNDLRNFSCYMFLS